MLAYLVFAALPVAAPAPTFPATPPDVAGPFREADWRGARRARMIGGGELRLLRSGREVYVAVLGATRGYPSLCVGNAQRVEILHASAALGILENVRTDGVGARFGVTRRSPSLTRRTSLRAANLTRPS